MSNFRDSILSSLNTSHSFSDCKIAKVANTYCHPHMKRKLLHWLAILSNRTKNCRLGCIKYVRLLVSAQRPSKADFVARKYRDEPRPRQGLLRTKEFLMKDLYTFDATTEQALQTYEAVRQAYSAFFGELKIPYLTAKASSGEIGGNLSHEYHYPSKKGEDNLVCCDTCDYIVNEELAESRITRDHRLSKVPEEDGPISQEVCFSRKHGSKIGSFGPEKEHLDAKIRSPASEGKIQWLGISQDRSTLIHAFLPHEVEVGAATGKVYRKTEINPHAIKRIFPEIDLAAEDPLGMFKAARIMRTTEGKPERGARILRIIDMRYLLQQPLSDLSSPSSIYPRGVDVPVEDAYPDAGIMVDLVRIGTGDCCPNCGEGTLKIESAVELGHTFNLGTRYSKPLEAMIDADPLQKTSQQETLSISDQAVTPINRVPMQMGCHGIGVSRLLAAVADSLADDKGLNWPGIIAPFEAVIIATKGAENGAVDVYDLLATGNGHRSLEPIDAILDDRKRDFGWKMKDADMIGYPIIVILGRGWKMDRKCEVQCRRLGIKESVHVDDLNPVIRGLLQRL